MTLLIRDIRLPSRGGADAAAAEDRRRCRHPGAAPPDRPRDRGRDHGAELSLRLYAAHAQAAARAGPWLRGAGPRRGGRADGHRPEAASEGEADRGARAGRDGPGRDRDGLLGCAGHRAGRAAGRPPRRVARPRRGVQQHRAGDHAPRGGRGGSRPAARRGIPGDQDPARSAGRPGRPGGRPGRPSPPAARTAC